MSKAAEHESFLQRLEKHKAILYKVANAYCSRREDRGDLIQEIVVELWRSFGRFDGRVAFSTWMHRIAMNVAISFYRGESRRIRDALPIEAFGLDLTAADNVMDVQSEDLHALHQMISRLDEINRALILLYLEGYPQEEIADMVGISSSNVATRINRIKQKLQKDVSASEETA